jgi:NADPH-dependent 2,4-dienoyl-CoA reductase/sulfur reductase-like enzyme
MSSYSRREVAKLFGQAGLVLAGAAASPHIAMAQIAKGARPKVVIIGGGAGGGTLTHLLRRGTPEIEVTLIEPKTHYSTCFFSNLCLGGLRPFDSIAHDYQGLVAVGAKVVNDWVVSVDTTKKLVQLKGGGTVPYDKLVVSPGIDFKQDIIPGYDEGAEKILPHAYRAGPQMQLLADQLAAMPDGGVVVLAPPPNPYRCPPGPYERACMIAHYLKTNKPRSKLIIVDPKPAFSKQALFVEAFDTIYKGLVELHLTSPAGDFSLSNVDTSTKEISTVAGLKIKAAVANIIPAQQAGGIAHKIGCTQGDWCPVNPETFASTLVKDVYVIGDAAIAGEMPKSAFSANSQAKAVTSDLEAIYAGKPTYPARYRNTCWSTIAPGNAVKIGAAYSVKDGKITAFGSFVSKPGEDVKTRIKTFAEAQGWYAGIVAEIFNRRVEQL